MKHDFVYFHAGKEIWSAEETPFFIVNLFLLVRQGKEPLQFFLQQNYYNNVANVIFAQNQQLLLLILSNFIQERKYKNKR